MKKKKAYIFYCCDPCVSLFAELFRIGGGTCRNSGGAHL
jgi:hypothetical protein